MEGLEINEILLSQIYESAILRLESEFYNSEYITAINTIAGEKAISYAQYGTSAELNETNEGYPILRLNEFNSSFISVPAKYCNRIDEQIYQSLKLKKNDVLICRTNGNPHFVGKSALVPKDYEYAFASYLFRIRPNSDFINSATLVTFLNSKYGRREIEKYSMVSNQANFSPAKFKEIRVPLFSSHLMDEIERLTYLAFECLENSITTYQAAEELLQNTIAINATQLTTTFNNVKTIQQSYHIYGRLDAEYYLPKYEEIIDKISHYPYGHDKIENLYIFQNKNFLPDDKVQYKYIELSDIGVNGEISGCTYDYGSNLPSRARRIVHTGDIIISSIEGSLQSCAIITEEYDSALCSTGFYVLSPRIINPETSLVMFKSSAIQALLKRACTGTILTAMNKDEFIAINLPVINKDIQNKIADIIRQSTVLRSKSKHLLKIAKTAVEIAIEKGENLAMELLNL